jgi:hypothetical protein
MQETRMSRPNRPRQDPKRAWWYVILVVAVLIVVVLIFRNCRDRIEYGSGPMIDTTADTAITSPAGSGYDGMSDTGSLNDRSDTGDTALVPTPPAGTGVTPGTGAGAGMGGGAATPVTPGAGAP